MAVNDQSVGSELSLKTPNRLDLSLRNKDLRIGQSALFATRPKGGILNQDGGRISEYAPAFQRRARNSRFLQLAKLLLLFFLFARLFFRLLLALRFRGLGFWRGLFLRWFFRFRRLAFFRRSRFGWFGFLSFGGLRLLGRRPINPAIDPDFAHFGLRLEITFAFEHRKIRCFAGLDGAKLLFHPA